MAEHQKARASGESKLLTILLPLENTIGVGCDLWALACTLYEIQTRSPLFENVMDDDDEVIMQMVPLLGKLPEPWWSSWKARGQ